MVQQKHPVRKLKKTISRSNTRMAFGMQMSKRPMQHNQIKQILSNLIVSFQNGISQTCPTFISFLPEDGSEWWNQDEGEAEW